jgi:predicted DNA-binding transcriptional regulator YafY
MLKLHNLYKSLILENIDRQKVIDAIDKRYRVNIDYIGDEETTPGKRTIEIYVFGVSKAGNLIIRAYQGFGKTTTVIPSWKTFRLDRISQWTPINTVRGIFNTPISDRGEGIPAFNPNGDKSMSTVYKIANFNKNKIEKDGY